MDTQTFISSLAKSVDRRRILTSPLQRLAYGTDASFYRLTPEVVVLVHSEEEVIAVMQLSHAMKIPVTFRAAGTSLSGQSITDSVLVVATNKWRNCQVLDNGLKIRLQPGVTGARANICLKPYGRKIGPDPASINAAMIGGIASNNSSGMCCGTSQNSYRTVADIRLILHDGTILDTSDEASKADFRRTHTHLITSIEQLRDRVNEVPALVELIHRKYKIKNTMGYSINAFVDYSDPFDIIKHLLIGAEGTLGFIAAITYNTVVDEPFKACALLIFDTIDAACNAVPFLKQCPVAAVELLDRDSVWSVENDPDAPPYFATLPETACILLVEIQGHTAEELAQKELAVRQTLEQHVTTIRPYTFTSDPKEYSFNWKARKGLLSSVGGLRRTGTTCIIEDVAFPLNRLAEGCLALKAIFKRFGYTDASLFGHALDGNIHLVFSQDFSSEQEVARYASLMNVIADTVVDRFGGSLKAEHGTGRNMAPFVEREWGKEAYRVMKWVKDIFDPLAMLNPDVIISDNPYCHLENFKPLPAVDTLIDKCMECGFCEPNCVAAGLTLSPRQRIVIAREIARLSVSAQDDARLKALRSTFDYSGNQTCATDGLCGLLCPVNIDTGKFIKSLRHDVLTDRKKRTAHWLGTHIQFITAVGRGALDAVYMAQRLLGDKLTGAAANGLRWLSGKMIPQWYSAMPRGATRIHTALTDSHNDREKRVIYFPSCINRTMGVSTDYRKDDLELRRTTERLLARAGYTVIYPEGIDSLCCGMSFSSKGYKEEGTRKAAELEAALWEASDGGAIPTLFDMSPCFYTFREAKRNPDLRIFDPIEFMLTFVMPELTIKRRCNRVAVFPVCSVKKINMEDNLLKLAEMCAKEVIRVESNCCGFAGDKGFTVPELNAHGQRHLREQLPDNCCGYSTSRTCEIGMTNHGAISFRSIFYLIDEATR
ncbi:MAG: FAD-binding oxidoreductase [Prevotellaceae bacterium]|jgi:D-lactate dehydrogenase|nr:FAD-binding oxidoreductase [Prevotellaceae bacterium]